MIVAVTDLGGQASTHHCWMGYALYILPSEEDASGKGNTHVGLEDSHKSIWCPLPRQRRQESAPHSPPQVHETGGQTISSPALAEHCNFPVPVNFTRPVESPPGLLLLFSHSVISDSLWPYGLQHARLPCPFTISWSLLNSCPAQPSHPLLSASPPAFNLSPHQDLFQWVGSLHQVAKSIGASASASINLSSEYSGLISFRMDWFDLLAVQGTFKSFPQHHNLKASILRHSAFFMVQLSHPYMTTGKAIALNRHLFEGSLGAQRVKHLPAMQETQVWSQDWEDPLEKEMATHSSTLA